jgi:hypothetical protein
VGGLRLDIGWSCEDSWFQAQPRLGRQRRRERLEEGRGRAGVWDSPLVVAMSVKSDTFDHPRARFEDPVSFRMLSAHVNDQHCRLADGNEREENTVFMMRICLLIQQASQVTVLNRAGSVGTRRVCTALGP